MKKFVKTCLSITSLLLLASCQTGTTSSGASTSSSSQTSTSGTIASSDSASSSGSTSTGASSTTITPEETDDYEDAGYSFSYIEDYSTAVETSSIETLLADTTLPDTYTTISDEEASITEAGSYYLTGSGTTSILLALTTAGNVHLYLDGATLSGASKAIESDSSDLTSQLTITLLNSSTNTISTTKNSMDLTCDLVINGSGTLAITSSGKSTIKTSKACYVGAVTLTLNAQGYEDGHGISAETIYAKSATINVQDCGKDGLHAEIADAGLTSYVNSAGFVYLDTVTFTYVGEGDGIQADSFLYIKDGSYNITTSAHFVAYGSDEATEYEITDSDDFKYTYSNGTYTKVESEMRGVSGTYAMANSVKGFKVGEIDQEDDDGNSTDISSQYYEIAIDGGTFTFDTDDDCIHTNLGSLVLTDANITASTLDQPLSSDGPLTINDSTVNITDCYEGIQGSSIHINGDSTNISINASDDAINASTDYLEEDTTFYRIQLNINAGYVKAVGGGDGLDSNGCININGGTVYVEGASSGAESPIDSAEATENSQDYGVYVYGGTLLATGSSEMLESPRDSSTQNILVYGATSAFSAGTVISVQDSSGSTLISYTCTNGGAAIILSSPDFVLNSTYSIYLNGTKATDVTLTSLITTSGNVSAGTGQNGFPGGGDQGGDQGGGPGGDQRP